ncbi:jg23187 [Pararge aegeria aegeria]|uniref:Jg23187 protein n=1 Tax=Pararge aegeria aegeria TaxID=348720 RepID=A0A8S4QER6_9NEOP|nr:jg23187 [Pararge aegeria aegeria]
MTKKVMLKRTLNLHKKKKRNQKINEPKYQPKKSSKGKGVGKRTKNICAEKENKQPSPTAHCSYAFNPIIDKSNNLPTPDNEKEQHSDWSDTDVENMPIVLSEDLEFCKEIIIPYEGKEIRAINDDRN